MVMTTFVTMAEMLKLAENSGVDSTQIPEILADGFANSQVLQLFGQRMARRDPELTGRLTIAQKDLDLIRAVGRETGTPLPMCGTATEVVRLAIARGLGDRDVSQFIRLYD
jgi:2-hydroxy-3-oxopropionate reductase